MSEDMPGRMPEDMPDRMPEDMPDRMPEGMPDSMPDKMSDRMPEDLPVTKCINVMVGITRSKVIFGFISGLAWNFQDNKAVRVASYRQVQAMSQQMNFLTNGRFATLSDFEPPDGVNIKAVGHGEKRFKQQEAGRIRAGLRDLNTGTESFLLPLRRDWWLDVPLLVLQLDQGPTCCGSVAPPDLDLALF